MISADEENFDEERNDYLEEYLKEAERYESGDKVAPPNCQFK